MTALLAVDLQNDFLPGGALAVPGGDEVIPVISRLAHRFQLVVATQDWHPLDHVSFAANHPGRNVGDVLELDGLVQVLWPVHCVQKTNGAALAHGVANRVDRVFQKGEDPSIDSYSAFFDNGHRKATGLADFLRSSGVDELYVCGLATDYCVKFTALDAAGLSFRTHLVIDACRGVEVHAGDIDAAVARIRAGGVDVVRSAEVEQPER